MSSPFFSQKNATDHILAQYNIYHFTSFVILGLDLLNRLPTEKVTQHNMVIHQSQCVPVLRPPSQVCGKFLIAESSG